MVWSPKARERGADDDDDDAGRSPSGVASPFQSGSSVVVSPLPPVCMACELLRSFSIFLCVSHFSPVVAMVFFFCFRFLHVTLWYRFSMPQVHSAYSR